MNTQANKILSAIRAELDTLPASVRTGNVTEIKTVTGAVITAFEQAEAMAVEATMIVNGAGLVALRAIAGAMATAPAEMTDKDLAARLHTLSTLRASCPEDVVSATSFGQYISLVRRCEKLNFDFSSFKGGINALQKALKDAADSRKAAEEGLTLEAFQASKAAARAAKKAGPETIAATPAVSPLVEEAKAAASEASGAAKVIESAPLAHMGEAMEKALTGLEAENAALKAENAALKDEVTRLQAALAKRSSRTRAA